MPNSDMVGVGQVGAQGFTSQQRADSAVVSWKPSQRYLWWARIASCLRAEYGPKRFPHHDESNRPARLNLPIVSQTNLRS